MDEGKRQKKELRNNEYYGFGVHITLLAATINTLHLPILLTTYSH